MKLSGASAGLFNGACYAHELLAIQAPSTKLLRVAPCAVDRRAERYESRQEASTATGGQHTSAPNVRHQSESLKPGEMIQNQRATWTMTPPFVCALAGQRDRTACTRTARPWDPPWGAANVQQRSGAREWRPVRVDHCDRETAPATVVMPLACAMGVVQAPESDVYRSIPRSSLPSAISFASERGRPNTTRCARVNPRCTCSSASPSNPRSQVLKVLAGR